MKPPISSGSSPSSPSSCALAEIAERPEADLQRLAERDDAADHRQPQEPVALRPGDERLGGDLDLAERGRPALVGPGLRTATAQVETPRIITPSSTAWPPTGASREATGMPSGIRGRVGSMVLGGRAVGARSAEVAAQSRRLRAARRLKRSTRPPVSTSFCLPV